VASFASLLICEARKQARLKLPYIGLAGAAIMAAIWPYTMQYYSDTSSPFTGYENVARTMQAMGTMLFPVFTVIFAATLVAGETSHRTLHYVLCRPIARMEFLASKFAAGFFYAFVMMAVGAVVVALVIGAMMGYATRVDQVLGVEIHPAEFWGQFSLVCLMSLVSLFATVAYGVFVSVLFRNTGAAVGVAAGLLVALEPIKQMKWAVLALFVLRKVGALSQERFASLLSQWGGFTIDEWVWTSHYGHPFNLVVNFAAGTPDLWNTPQTWLSLAIPAVWGVGFAVAAAVIMMRRDWG